MKRWSTLILISSMLMVSVLLASAAKPALAAPTSVTITGNLQSELGCPGDFQPSCANSALAFDAVDGVWQGTFGLSPGAYNYFAALNGSFAQTYGLHGGSALTPVTLSLGASQPVKFYYDDSTHWVTDNVNTPIVVLAGNFQSQLGCGGDFNPGCLRSWLEDVDGDGIYTRTLSLLPGSYNTVVTIGESFAETYGPNGVRNGGNIGFVVPDTALMTDVTFCYDGSTHVLQVGGACTSPTQVPEPASLAQLATSLLAIVALRRRKAAAMSA